MDNESFLNEPKVAAWKKSLEDSGYTINAITPLNLLYRANGELLFALLKVDAVDGDGWPLVPYVFIRGHACIIVPLLRSRATGEERFMMVRQRRIGHGRPDLEFPAGMLDRDIHDPAGVAVRELEEETGLAINAENLLPLVDGPLYSSPGAADEGIYYFGVIVEMDEAQFRSFEGKMRGSAAESEHIRVELKTRDEAEQDTISLQARLAFFLFDRARPLLERKALQR